MLLRLGFTKANFIADFWHLKQNLEKNFNQYYGLLKPYLTKMINANSEQEFDRNAFDARTLIPTGNQTMLEYFDRFVGNRDSYSAYISHKYEGSQFQRSSNMAEQNHSSVLSFLSSYQKQKYQKSVHCYTKDLLRRQNYFIDKCNHDIADAVLKKIMLIDQIKKSLSFNDHYMERFISKAIDILTMSCFEIFQNEVLSMKDYVREWAEGTIVVRKHDHPHISYHTFAGDETIASQRCNCAIGLSHMIQCRHELIAYEEFRPHFFASRYMFRDAQSFCCDIWDWQNSYSSNSEEWWDSLKIYRRSLSQSQCNIDSDTWDNINQEFLY